MSTVRPFATGFSAFLLFLTTLLTTASAEVPSVSYSLSNPLGDKFDIALNVPSPNANDDLYFHVNTNNPATWIAFGFGDQMAGSLMFVFYASADGKNVTVSPRLGGNHVMPEHTSDVKVEVLAGSGIINDSYVVNARCTGCRQWSGGSIDVKSTSQSMIWAVQDADTLESDDLNASIGIHSHEDTFNLNIAQAVGVAGVPVVSAGSNNGGSVPVDGDDDDGFDSNLPRRLHAVFMVGSFLIGFPGGYLLLRVFDSVKVHMAIQSLTAAVILLGGLGTGIAMSVKQNISPKMNAPHQIIGFVVAAFVLTAWTVGFVGHLQFRKTGSPAPPMKIHRILGPATISLGVVNCAVGFHFAGNNHGIIGFMIFAVLVILVVTSVLLCTRRRKARNNAMNSAAAQNFREGQMERDHYAGAAPPYQEAVPLQPYGGAPRPQPYTLPSYQSDGGYPQGPPPRV